MIEVFASDKVWKGILAICGIGGGYALYLNLTAPSAVSGALNYIGSNTFQACKLFVEAPQQGRMADCKRFYLESVPKLYSRFNKPKIKMPTVFGDQDVVKLYSQVQDIFIELKIAPLPPLEELTNGELEQAL